MAKLSRREILTLLGVDEGFLVELEREEIVHCDDQGAFSSREAERVRLGWTMHHDLGLNLEGVDVALRLLDRIYEERRQYRAALERIRARVESAGEE
jgi:hypothetical protein